MKWISSAVIFNMSTMAKVLIIIITNFISQNFVQFLKSTFAHNIGWKMHIWVAPYVLFGLFGILLHLKIASLRARLVEQHFVSHDWVLNRLLVFQNQQILLSICCVNPTSTDTLAWRCFLTQPLYVIVFTFLVPPQHCSEAFHLSFIVFNRS